MGLQVLKISEFHNFKNFFKIIIIYFIITYPKTKICDCFSFGDYRRHGPFSLKYEFRLRFRHSLPPPLRFSPFLGVCIWVDKRLFQIRRNCFSRLRWFCLTICCQICLFWKRRRKFRNRKGENRRANKSATATTFAPSVSTTSGKLRKCK